MEKILIYTDRTKEQDFLKSVTDTRDKCNNLIEVYENFQSWRKIDTLQDWLSLVSDPEAYFDKTLLQNVEIKATGGKKPDPSLLAPMFEIDRSSYLNIVAGRSVTDPDCVPCRKLKVRKATHAISLLEFQSYQDYLIFDSGSFILNETTINEAKETFKTYASNGKQVTILNHWQELCAILNRHMERGYIGTTAIEQAGKLFGLRYVGGEGKLYVNEANLLSEILKAK